MISHRTLLESVAFLLNLQHSVHLQLIEIHIKHKPEAPIQIDKTKQKKIFFCYASNKIELLANLGALISKMILLFFFFHVTFLRKPHVPIFSDSIQRT